MLPGIKHKVIALLSGGKDSCFNLMHCVANGHEVVAVATLTPEPGTDELDSHLYQSVGTGLLPLIAQALDLPLFTQIIRGKAVSRGPEYGSRLALDATPGDETEDLTRLLQTVILSHPAATALASGAILSTYQRLRIEHVCSRLGLVSLSYLWQQAQLPLLESMLASGVEAIIVKVAGVGLGVDVVGKQLREVMPLLRRLERTYGSHPAGEGGEYETLTLSTPQFSHRLSITQAETVVTDPEPYPVAYLRVSEAELVQKPEWVRPTIDELRCMLHLGDIDGLDDQSRKLMEEVGPWQSKSALALTCRAGDPGPSTLRFAKRRRWFAASATGTDSQPEVGEELRSCFDAIAARLADEGLSLSLHVAHITLLLSDMSLFAAVNRIYSQYFGTSPPSRATIAVPLPSRVRVEVVGYDDRPNGVRQALHVQGLSYWASANIGPYSQAVMVNERIHLAGQIPLLPASLTLPEAPTASSPYPHQAILALQHVRRIIDALRSRNATGGGWTGYGESCVAWWAVPETGGGEGLDVVRKAWETWAPDDGWHDVPVILVRALRLPRDALVEFQVGIHTGRSTIDTEDNSLLGTCFRGGDEEMWWESIDSGNGQGFKAAVFASSRYSTTADMVRILDRTVSIKIFHLASASLGMVESQISHNICLTFVPVLQISDRHGRPAVIALECFGE